MSDAPDVASSPAPDLSSITGPAPQPPPPNPLMGSPLPNASAPAPQDQSPAQSPSAASTLSAPMAGTPSVWKQVVQGALLGLSGGGPNFASGVASGAKVESAAIQQQADNQQRAQFESMQAAHQAALAFQQSRAADDTHQEAQLRLQKQADELLEIAGEHGIVPKVSISGTTPNDINSQAAGALQTLADGNGGKVGRVVAVNSPDGKNADQSHDIHVFSTTPSDVDTNSTGTLWLINALRSAKQPNAPPLSQSDAQVMGGQVVKGNWKAGVASMANDAQQFLFQAPPLSSGKDAVSDNNAQIQTLTQQLANYQKAPNPDPQIVQLLQHKVDVFSSMVDGLNKANIASKNQEVLGTAGAEADAAKQKTAAEQSTPQGQANLAKTIQEKITSQNTNADKGVQQMWANGTNPATGEKLSLANAPDEMLVDQKTGLPIPTKMLSTLKPTQTESNRADFARSVLHSLDNLDTLEQEGKLPNGPLKGVTAASLAKVGLGDKDIQTALNDVSFVQSAATGAHVGGRFSLPVMDKMNAMLGLNMNSDQFAGAKDSIRNVMQQYATQGGRMTVAEYKQDQAAKQNATPQTHVFNSQAWAQANPGKDVNAAIRQAQNQGYKVQ
jgi:hypothetical protein